MHRLANELNGAAHAGKLHQLLIIADPRSLGRLRKELDDYTSSLVMAEYDKDLTRHSDAEVSEFLNDTLPEGRLRRQFVPPSRA